MLICLYWLTKLQPTETTPDILYRNPLISTHMITGTPLAVKKFTLGKNSPKEPEMDGCISANDRG